VSDREFQKILDKLGKLAALRQARGRVRQLERELYGEPARHEESAQIPEFLGQHANDWRSAGR